VARAATVPQAQVSLVYARSHPEAGGVGNTSAVLLQLVLVGTPTGGTSAAGNATSPPPDAAAVAAFRAVVNAGTAAVSSSQFADSLSATACVLVGSVLSRPPMAILSDADGSDSKHSAALAWLRDHTVVVGAVGGVVAAVSIAASVLAIVWWRRSRAAGAGDTVVVQTKPMVHPKLGQIRMLEKKRVKESGLRYTNSGMHLVTVNIRR
jgi:hypothetical protein